MAEFESDTPPPSSLFRPSKRRKILRTRAVDEETITSPPKVPSISEQDEPSISKVLRLRKPKQRKAGIEFSTAVIPRPIETSVTKYEADQDEVSAMDIASSRFAPQTGLVAEMSDKHMMAYVDSKLAEMRSGSLEPRTTLISSNTKFTQKGTGLDSGHLRIPSSDLTRPRQPVGAGKLMEIDLGPDATLQNIARTEAATRRMQGIEEPATDSGDSRKKVRLGPDGKPWRGRGKKRTSEDLRRDRLVEEVLKEAKMEIYDLPAAEGSESAAEVDGQTADDRLAEQFKQEFLDAQLARNNRKAPAAPAAKPGEEKLKGPKLGGSRAARAAMHKALEEAAKKK